MNKNNQFSIVVKEIVLNTLNWSFFTDGRGNCTYIVIAGGTGVYNFISNEIFEAKANGKMFQNDMWQSHQINNCGNDNISIGKTNAKNVVQI